MTATQAPGLATGQSPFRFLAPYAPGDKGYCGREAETDALHEKLLRHRLVMVYGLSGTGKTSLIQCGLAGKLRADVDWLPLWVRHDGDIAAATRRALAGALGRDVPAEQDLPSLVRDVYRQTLLPVYLIFDQFEELLLLDTAARQTGFFAEMRALLDADVNLRIIISLREEYIGALTPFEAQLPELFDCRQRLAPMDAPRLAAMVEALLAALDVGLEGGAATASAIAARLGTGNFQLAHLQLYLDQLYRDAPVQDGRRTIGAAQVAAIGGLDAIIRRLVDEQIAAADAAASRAAEGIGAAASKAAEVIDAATSKAVAGAPMARRLLDRLLTLEGTKRPRTRSELALAGVAAAAIDAALAAMVSGRILRLVNDRFELGHDWLAAEIAELRSTEERQLATYRRIVVEGCARQAGDFPNAWLAREEVTLIRPHADRLELTEAEMAYLDRSHRIRRRQRAGVIGGTLAVIAVLSAALGLVNQARQDALAARNEAQRTVEVSTESAANVAALISQSLASIPRTGSTRIDMVNSSIRLIEQLHGGQVPMGDADGRYADLLLQRAMLLYQNGQTAAARKQLDEAMARAGAVLRVMPGNAEWRGLQARARTQQLDFIGDLKERRQQALALLADDPSTVNTYNVLEKDIQLGDMPAARAHLAALRQKTVGQPYNMYDQLFLQFGQGNLALLEGDMAAAAAAFEKAAIAGARVRDDTESIGYRYYAAASFCQSARTLRAIRRSAAAAAAQRQADALLVILAGQQPTVDLADIIGNCRDRD